MQHDDQRDLQAEQQGDCAMQKLQAQRISLVRVSAASGHHPTPIRNGDSVGRGLKE